MLHHVLADADSSGSSTNRVGPRLAEGPALRSTDLYGVSPPCDPAWPRPPGPLAGRPWSLGDVKRRAARGEPDLLWPARRGLADVKWSRPQALEERLARTLEVVHAFSLASDDEEETPDLGTRLTAQAKRTVELQVHLRDLEEAVAVERQALAQVSFSIC